MDMIEEKNKFARSKGYDDWEDLKGQCDDWEEFLDECYQFYIDKEFSKAKIIIKGLLNGNDKVIEEGIKFIKK